jgi:O-antigen ligase
MAYLLALLYVICVYVRPAEVVPGWEQVPVAEIVAVVATLCVIGSLVLRPRRFWNLPQDWFVAGFLIAIGLSNAAWGWMSGALAATLTMAPAIFCYFLIRSAVESRRQLRWFGYTLVMLTVFHALNGIVQFHTGVGIGEVAPIEAHSLAGGDQDAIPRIRGTGIFNDPNDLALTLVIAVPFVAGPLFRRTTSLAFKMAAFTALGSILIALYYTNSRGGILGLGAALLPYGYRRYGRVAGSVGVAIGLAVLIMLGPSRMANLGASESSAQDRVQSWAEGLQMFKAHPLFGVGFGRYTEFNDLVAHNSFVHTLGELGFFGAFCFVGMGYWFFRSVTASPASPDADWGRDLCHSGLALVVCAMFLSRQYNMLLFVWLAMGGAYAQVVGTPVRPSPSGAVVHLTRISAITACGVICTYAVVRLCGNWSA